MGGAEAYPTPKMHSKTYYNIVPYNMERKIYYAMLCNSIAHLFFPRFIFIYLFFSTVGGRSLLNIFVLATKKNTFLNIAYDENICSRNWGKILHSNKILKLVNGIFLAILSNYSQGDNMCLEDTSWYLCRMIHTLMIS